MEVAMQACSSSPLASPVMSPMTMRRCHLAAMNPPLAQAGSSGTVLDALVLKARRAAAARTRRKAVLNSSLLSSDAGQIKLTVVQPDTLNKLATTLAASPPTVAQTAAIVDDETETDNAASAGAIHAGHKLSPKAQGKRPARRLRWRDELCTYASFYSTDAPMHVGTRHRKLSLLEELCIRASDASDTWGAGGSCWRSPAQSSSSAALMRTKSMFTPHIRAGLDSNTSPFTARAPCGVPSSASGRRRPLSTSSSLALASAAARSASVSCRQAVEMSTTRRAATESLPARRRTLVFDHLSLPRRDALASKLKVQKVQLESVTIRAPHVFLTVRVANIDMHKKVTVRHSANGWKAHMDEEARYVRSVGVDADQFFVSRWLHAFALSLFCSCKLVPLRRPVCA